MSGEKSCAKLSALVSGAKLTWYFDALLFAGHTFVKEGASATCAFCNNVWSSKDKITSKYQICSLCGRYYLVAVEVW